MLCKKCGHKNNSNNNFCSNCNNEIINQENKKNSTTTLQYYGRDWGKFDLMIDDKYLYLIKLPNFKMSLVGSIIGFLFLGFPGFIIGAIIGTKNDSEKKKYYRTAWIDFDNNIISNVYKNHIFLRIPLYKIKTSLIFKKILTNNYISLSYGDVRLTLKNNKDEYIKFNNFLKDYVL